MSGWLRCVRLIVPAFFCLAATSGSLANGLTAWGGGPTPALALTDIQGRAHDLKAHRGKVVLVNFWATWCEPCRQEMPSIRRLRDRLGGKPFAVFMVNVDEPDARVRRFLSEAQIDLPVLLDRDKLATKAWGVRVLPASFLVGPDGRIRYRLIGDMDWNSDYAVSVVSQIISGG